MIPNNAWIPIPLNQEPTQFTLPEEFEVYYYVCNPGPYDPLQIYEKPIVTYIRINQNPFGDSGWKNGSWGWVAGIHWPWAYGDALIDAIWPPLEPTTVDEVCPNNVVPVADASSLASPTVETCPPDTLMTADTRTAAIVVPDRSQQVTFVEDSN